MKEIKANSFLVSATGGSLDYVAPDGEVLFSVEVPPGRVPASQYLQLLPDHCDLQVADGLVVVEPRSLIAIQPFGDGSHDTGANPDFQPTSASRFEMEMRLTLNKLQQQSERIEARERALAMVERIPNAPAPASAVETVADVPVFE